MVHPAGAGYMREFFASQAPRLVGPALFALVRRQLGKQLHARGIGRHEPKVIEAKGCSDLDAMATLLQGRTFLVADHPTIADAAVFGLVAPVVYWDMDTPVAAHARTLTAIRAYCDRMCERCLGVKERTAAASLRPVV